MKTEKNQGISLIVLVITIIVMIILATTIILSLAEGGIIDRAIEAVFKNDMNTIQEELAMYVAKQEIDVIKGKDVTSINASGDEMLEIIPSAEKYKDKIEIIEGQIVYVKDTNKEKEKAWYESIGIDAKTDAYAIYSETDNSLTFVRSNNEIKTGDTYNDKVVTAVFTGFENAMYDWRVDDTAIPWHNYRTSIKSVKVEDAIMPISLSRSFKNFNYCSMFNVERMDVSKVTNMNATFMFAGNDASVTEFKIIGLDNWDTSNVSSMEGTFREVGKNATNWSIGNLSKWDISQVTTMTEMFCAAGRNAKEFNIGDLGNWNTSKLTRLYGTFSTAGWYSDEFYIGELDNWDTSNVTSMYCLFQYAGARDTTWSVGDLSKWNTSKVIEMNGMFQGAGENSEEFDVGNLAKKEVTREEGMTYTAWDTSKVERMNSMFYQAGRYSKKWSIGDVSNWNLSNVWTMSSMFSDIAGNVKGDTVFTLGDITKWDVSKVTDMTQMFSAAATYANWSLDLSGWTVDQVTAHDNFNQWVETKVISPFA